MTESSEILQINAVRFARTLPGPLARVWSFLTERDKLQTWYGEDGRIEPRQGGSVWLMGGHIRGVVTQWQPHRRLTYSWNVFEPGDEVSGYPESYLTLELVAEGTEVALTLTHLPIPEWAVAQTRMGWHTYLDLIDAVANGRPAPSREDCMQRNAARYGVDLDNLRSGDD
jgi:uncharacterized protein YndB with AHSA1/START domain